MKKFNLVFKRRVPSTLLLLSSFFLVFNAYSETQAEKIFAVRPYTIKDDQNHFRIKFQLKEKNIISALLKRKFKGQINEEVILAPKLRMAGPVYEIVLNKEECGQENKISFYGQESFEIEQLSIPKENCVHNNQIEVSGEPQQKILLPVIFGHISDTQTDQSKHQRIADVIKAVHKDSPIQFILNTGDIVDLGTSTDQWLQFFRTANTYLTSIPMVAAIGNHDYYGYSDNSVPSMFFQYLRWEGHGEEGFYSISYPHFELIVFNSNLHHLSEKQKAVQWLWLENKLSMLQQLGKTAIVSTHYPLLSSSIWTVTDSSSREMRKIMIPMFEKYNVKLVLSGHTHLYERSYKDGVNYVIAGPAGGLSSISTVKNPYQVVVKRGIGTFSTIAVDRFAIELRTFDEQSKEIDFLQIPLDTIKQ